MESRTYPQYDGYLTERQANEQGLMPKEGAVPVELHPTRLRSKDSYLYFAPSDLIPMTEEYKERKRIEKNERAKKSRQRREQRKEMEQTAELRKEFNRGYEQGKQDCKELIAEKIQDLYEVFALIGKRNASKAEPFTGTRTGTIIVGIWLNDNDPDRPRHEVEPVGLTLLDKESGNIVYAGQFRPLNRVGFAWRENKEITIDKLMSLPFMCESAAEIQTILNRYENLVFWHEELKYLRAVGLDLSYFDGRAREINREVFSDGIHFIENYHVVARTIGYNGKIKSSLDLCRFVKYIEECPDTCKQWWNMYFGILNGSEDNG